MAGNALLKVSTEAEVPSGVQAWLMIVARGLLGVLVLIAGRGPPPHPAETAFSDAPGSAEHLDLPAESLRQAGLTWWRRIRSGRRFQTRVRNPGVSHRSSRFRFWVRVRAEVIIQLEGAQAFVGAVVGRVVWKTVSGPS